MSRYIEAKASVTITEEEEQLRKMDRAKLLFTSFKGRDCALYLQDDRLVEAAFLPPKASKVGAVFLGRVANVVKNIDACFVEISRKELCFLSLKNLSSSCLLNRKFDGRVAAGDELLVQIVRDASKTKQAVVTNYITLENDYFVLSAGSAKVCYSSKLTKGNRLRLEQLLSEAGIITNDGGMVRSWRNMYPEPEFQRICSEGFQPEMYSLPEIGLIVRTKAGQIDCVEDMLLHFYELSMELARILRAARHRSSLTCLREAQSGYETIVSQFISETDKREIITDSEAFYKTLNERMPDADCPVRLYQDTMISLSAIYSLESKMEAALNSRVWLKSGAYLVIEATEALTVIDVNSGKFKANDIQLKHNTGYTDDAMKSVWNLERASCLEVNLEAAREVAVQLRLRNLSGIIIVDFISMRKKEDNQRLLQYMRDLAAQDRISTTVIDMTPLGLVEITRKKINKPLQEQYQQYFANS